VFLGGNGDRVRAIVENGPNRSRGGVWVADDRPGVAAFPVELGDSIRVVADGLDSDGDGRAGIEQGDVVRLVYVTDGGEVENGLRWTIGASGNATAG
jgi:predicted RNA-binding protein with TRAM domain